MVKLRAEEHRYLVTAEGEADALVRRIPGCRYVAAARALQLPRQPGTVIALDRLFGEHGWECPADLAIEVAETRGRQHAPAEHEAHVALAGNELSVECAFGDKELVKLVPGYRWSAPQRRWFLPASPLALELLAEHFGPKLEVEPAATEYLALKARDEEETLERARTATVVAAPPVEVHEPLERPPIAPDGQEESDLPVAAPAISVEALIERLAGAVEALERTVARLAERIPEAPAAVPSPAPAPAPEQSAPVSDPSWREWLAVIDADPSDALSRLSPQLQLAGEDDLAALRALAGVAASLNSDFEGALTFLRKAEEHSAVPLDPELQARSRGAYREAVFALVTQACGPQRPIASLDALEELVLAELVHDSGFDDAKVASRAALDLLSFLMDDAHLRRFDPRLSDFCRLLQLLAVARGGKWMAAERVIEMLRHRDLTSDGFALGLIVLSNTVFEQPCMEEWLMRWPPEASTIGFDDLRWLVDSGVPRLRVASPRLGEQASLAMLGLISGAPVEVAQMDQRRELVRLIPPGSPPRRYAEFLAGYQLAAAGHKRVAQDFPGYLQMLAESSLSQSAPHLLTVFVSDSGGAGSTTRRIAEEVFLESVVKRGVADPAQVIELLDMLAESPKGDHLVNQLGRFVEEDGFPGAGTFSHEHRLTLFERAFRLALKAGHDIDCIEAFDRLVRELTRHGETESVRTLCLGVSSAFKPLQLPVGQALLTLQLEAGEPFEAAAEMVLRMSDLTDPRDEGAHELRGLAIAFPKFRDFLDAQSVALDDEPERSFAGKKLLVVGGHEWLRKLALPRFEAWGVKASWLDPDSATNGAQALDLAAGTDLVIVNTACISHAASNRVRAQADKANVRRAYHNSRGVGALLSIARQALADEEPPVADSKTETRHERRRRLVR